MSNASPAPEPQRLRLTFHRAPNGGWLEFPLALATELGLLASFSSQSRRLDDTLFLIEEPDAIAALSALIGADQTFEISFRSYGTLSLISTYPPYQPEEG